jgi:hypothetical protein
MFQIEKLKTIIQSTFIKQKYFFALNNTYGQLNVQLNLQPKNKTLWTSCKFGGKAGRCAQDEELLSLGSARDGGSRADGRRDVENLKKLSS